MNATKLKELFPHLIAVAVIFLVTAAFFLPLFQGKKMYQGDIVSAVSYKQDIIQYKQETGKDAYWTQAIFGGMPMVTNYGKDFNYTGKVYTLLDFGIPRPASLIFKAMLFCYLALVLLGINPWISLIGAVCFGLSTNHIIITEAGHNSKIATIANFPLIVSGFMLAYRRQVIGGAILFALGTAMSIYTRHPQMLFYLFLVLGVGGLAYLVKAIREKELLPFAKATGLLLAGLGLAILSGLTHLQALQNYAKDSMRGDPILKTEVQDQPQSVQTSSSDVEGLDWDYAMQWSNATIDLASTIIPGVAGGSSSERIDNDAASARLLQGQGGPLRIPLYWGGLPFTSGPPYFGAVMAFLFLFSLFVFKPVLRYWAIFGVLLTVLLSLGSNFELLNRPFFELVPYYNKFRAPSSILVVTGGLIVIFGLLGLQRVLRLDAGQRSQYSNAALYAGGGLGIICLFYAFIAPGMLNFTGPGDARYQQEVLQLFIADRKDLMKADALRSFLFIAAAAGLLWAYLGQHIKWPLMIAGIGLLALTDFWGVGKRYLTEENYQNKRSFEANFQPRPVDQQIFQREPQGRGYYRVLDLSINTFNSSSTSYHHNTVGGYYAAKLQRIQDVIDRHIQRNNQRVLNMLNTKYIITQEQQLQVNQGALGPAWLVSEIIPVRTAQEEINALNTFNPGQEAVIKTNEFENYLQGFNPGAGDGRIELTESSPARLVYQTSTQQEELAVFSEIWYGPDKGWTVTIDGEPAKHIRANYVLRAMRIPAGEHQIEFTFDPARVYSASNMVSRASSLLIIAAALGMVGLNGYQWYQRPTPQPQPQRPASRKTTEKGQRSSNRKKKRKK